MTMMKLTELEFHRPDRTTVDSLSRICPVVLCSGDSIRPRWRSGERKIFNYLWVFIGSGEGVCKICDTEYNIRENDFIWIPPDTVYQLSGTSEKMHCIYAHVELLFSPERTHLFRIPGGVRDLSPWREYIHPAFGNDAIDSLCGVIRLANPLQVKMLFKELCKTHRLEPDRQFKLAGLVIEILDELLSSKRINNSLDRKIAEATVFIREHLNNNLDVTSLAKKFGLSPSYFRLLFRQTQGTAPVAFHRELRINEACNLMLNEGLNVSETANALGFSNIHNFSRAFKDLMRISPKKFCSGINCQTKKRSPASSQGYLNSN